MDGEVRDEHTIRLWTASDLATPDSIAHLLTGRKDTVITLSEAYALTPPKMHQWADDRDIREAGLKRQRETCQEKRRDAYNRADAQRRWQVSALPAGSWGSSGTDRHTHGDANRHGVRGSNNSQEYTQPDRPRGRERATTSARANGRSSVKSSTH